jgi:hypothetical protein
LVNEHDPTQIEQTNKKRRNLEDFFFVSVIKSIIDIYPFGLFPLRRRGFFLKRSGVSPAAFQEKNEEKILLTDWGILSESGKL